MASRARAVPVKLTVKRRRKLEQILAAGTSPQRLVLRAKIVLAAAAGAANAAIARDLLSPRRGGKYQLFSGWGRCPGAAQAEARAELGGHFAARARARAVSGSGGCLRTGRGRRPADDGRGVTAVAGYTAAAWPG